LLRARRISVFGVDPRRDSGNQESRHSLSGAGTDLPARQSREVAIKLTRRKKRDRVVNFLSGGLLARPRSALRRCTLRGWLYTRPSLFLSLSSFALPRWKGRYTSLERGEIGTSGKCPIGVSKAVEPLHERGWISFLCR